MKYYPGLTVDYAEQIVIEGAYSWFRGNKTQAAQAVGITVKTLHLKLEKYDADRRDNESRGKIIRPGQQAESRSGISLSGTSEGARLEPPAETRQESTMPVYERQEVQEMLPKQALRGRPRKSSKAV